MQDLSCKFKGDFYFLVNFFCPNFVLKGFFWLGNDFKGLSLIKLKLISFFIARYLTDSLRGPVLTLQNEALCAEFINTTHSTMWD